MALAQLLGRFSRPEELGFVCNAINPFDKDPRPVEIATLVSPTAYPEGLRGTSEILHSIMGNALQYALAGTTVNLQDIWLETIPVSFFCDSGRTEPHWDQAPIDDRKVFFPAARTISIKLDRVCAVPTNEVDICCHRIRRLLQGSVHLEALILGCGTGRHAEDDEMSTDSVHLGSMIPRHQNWAALKHLEISHVSTTAATLINLYHLLCSNASPDKFLRLKSITLLDKEWPDLLSKMRPTKEIVLNVTLIGCLASRRGRWYIRKKAKKISRKTNLKTLVGRLTLFMEGNENLAFPIPLDTGDENIATLNETIDEHEEPTTHAGTEHDTNNDTNDAGSDAPTEEASDRGSVDDDDENDESGSDTTSVDSQPQNDSDSDFSDDNDDDSVSPLDIEKKWFKVSDASMRYRTFARG